jgi:two-component system response regulator HydG
LKDRREDILPIARYILGKTASGSLGFSPQVAAALEAYDWPGNVRELENTIEYASIVAGKDKIRLEHLPAAITRNHVEVCIPVAQTDWPSLHALEEQYIQRVLEFCGGKKAQAAKLLGIGNNTLWRKLKK